MSVRRKLIRSTVDRLLRDNGINTRPVDVEGLAHALGVVVRKEPASDDLSGFIIRDPDKRSVVVGVNKSHSKTRQRFTLAHELGHFLLHEGEPLHVDRINRLFLVKRRDDRSREGTDPDEIEANVFAAELLMPASFLEEDLDRIGPIDPLDDEDTIKRLARDYGVSHQALLFRLANLGHVILE